MREALSGLTVRGRAFVAAGITAIVCAIVLGQTSLSRVGVLVLALPLVSALFIGRSRYRLALVRTVNPQLVAAGQPASVSLSLANEGRAPSGVLLLEDHLPYVLGTRPRFVLEGIGHGWHRDVTYQIRSDVRGRFEIGPVTVRVKDPFGLVELGRAFRTTVPLTVTPRTVPLTHIPLGGAWTGSGDNRPRAFAMGSAEDVTVREYRRGDDLRRVHWRSSARVGELMVRREEQPWESRATLFLDNRVVAHRGQGIASSLEAAVSAAASIAVHLSKRGFTVRLVTAAGEDTRQRLAHPRDRPQHRPAARSARRRATTAPARPRHRLADRGRRRRPAGRGARRTSTSATYLCCAGCTRTAARPSRWPSTSTRGSPPTPPGATRPRCSASRAGARSRSVRLTGSRRSGKSSGAATPRARGREASCPRRRRSRSAPYPWLRGSSPDARRPVRTRWRWPVSRPSPRPPPWSRCSPGRDSPRTFGSTLGPLFVVAVIVAGTGAVGRWWRLPRPLLVLAQVLLVGMVVCAFVCGSPLPIGEAWDRLVTAFQDAGQSANRFAPPVPATEPPVHPLLIAGGAACLLLVDILACTLRRVPLAGLPLLTIYSVPVSMTGDSPHWLLYTLTAIGFLGMIFLSESEQIARWGPILAEDHGHSEPEAPRGSELAAHRRAGRSAASPPHSRSSYPS